MKKEPDKTTKTNGTNRTNGKRPVRGVMIQMQFDLQRLAWWAVVGLMIFSLAGLWMSGSKVQKEVQLSQALEDMRAGKIEKVEVYADRLALFYTDKEDEPMFSRKEGNVSFTEILDRAQIKPDTVKYEIKDQTFGQVMTAVLPSVIGTGFVLLVLLYMMRQARGQQDSIFSFGQSRARLFDKGKQSVKFSDVAGVDEAKKELEEVVDFLKNPGKYKALGARTPKGALLIGPSGVGKTLLARAIAGEAGVPFYSMAGSEFMEMLVGVGSARVRDLFATAKKNAPSIIFIDEVDAIGRQRGHGLMGGHDEREQTLNQILVEMDGFTANENVVVLAATNRPELLDPALVRPGRFDRRVMVDMPDIEGRKAILAIYAKNKPFVKSVKWEAVAKRTVGFSGADLENMLNEAAIGAARESLKEITMENIEEAATKVKLGPQKKRLQSEDDRKMTAYHEAGHAVVNWAQKGLDPVHRISIVSRGMSLGHTLVPPAADRVHETKSRLLSQIAMMLGGRAAEELVFHEFTTGASNDIDKASSVARDMVMEYGMSNLGPINYGSEPDVIDWGRGYMEPTQISPDVQAKIDAEVKKIIDEGYKKAQIILKKHRKKMDKVVERLMKVETMDGDEFAKMMAN
ncbi:MAG: ATP-dependent zinc metalloprotease FtsH [Candidatus Amesbacteria bacterium GW2011_GWA2_47_11b]|uniref:ATP-dependent zinc metalloprotease FtsH n=2 Tax=Candidatus Amesiibacteriota TaxID=1752730 RepID=A0A0G1SJP4_9BACT|nr:MAG: ATP-dependent zinc metalloprotease FtsH [Microgenomates group bacterium GW2011_GWC1_46_20]KKU57142.1 MAG: ATP-dependent zinc metalloprotease FtsH [Candidatus Amesbacteria bacterium GW2011_GWA2_47_11b]KKU69699.1 MAG: ATP-dependent zinc metalloprotease FtsH [Candidatus Amesbacteria bacterium GW2011_GWA1_47_20]